MGTMQRRHSFKREIQDHHLAMLPGDTWLDEHTRACPTQLPSGRRILPGFSDDIWSTIEVRRVRLARLRRTRTQLNHLYRREGRRWRWPKRAPNPAWSTPTCVPWRMTHRFIQCRGCGASWRGGDGYGGPTADLRRSAA